MENWWINVYCIGFMVTCVIEFLTLRGMILYKYVWDKTYWTTSVENKGEYSAICAISLLAGLFWPLLLVLLVLVVVGMVLYGSAYLLVKKLRRN